MAAAIPYAIAAGGYLLQKKAAEQQAGEQRSQLNAAMARTEDTQKKSNQMVEQEAQKLSPIAQAAAMAAQTNANTTQAKADLASSGATDSSGNTILNTAGDDGAVSQDFISGKADRALQEGKRLSTIAQQLAKVRAPGQLVAQEGEDRANLTEALSNIWNTTKSLNDGNQLTAGGIQAPGYGALGEIAGSVGSAYAGKAKGASVDGSAKLVPKNAKGGWIWSGGDATSGGFA